MGELGVFCRADHFDAYGDLHRDDGPARVMPDVTDGRTLSQEWFSHGRRHRADGPAEIESHVNLAAVAAANARTDSFSIWWLDGARHRGDGPSRVAFDATAGIENASEYHYRGRQVHTGETKRTGAQRIDAAIAAGADPANAVGWLAYDDQVAQLCASVVAEPGDLLQAWDAGVRDPQMLLDVATGVLPLSWATAGL